MLDIMDKIMPIVYKDKSLLKTNQILVLQSALIQGFIRSNLYDRVSNSTKEIIYEINKKARKISEERPNKNNWLLFGAYLEYGFYKYYNDGNITSIEQDINDILKMYNKDGIFFDGNNKKFNYYSGYVFHPMLYELLSYLKDIIPSYENKFKEKINRMIQYSEYLVNTIEEDGSYPLIGRSLGFRYAILYSLSLSNYHHLHNHEFEKISRNKIIKVIDKYMKSGIFDENGFLYVGLYGHQENLEDYMCTGSVYFATSTFSILGLDETESFWK